MAKSKIQTKREVITFKTKTKQKKSKPKKTNRPKVQGMLAMQENTKNLVCSVLDPFSCSSCIPDGRTNSGCFTVKSSGTLSTGAGGSCCGLYLNPMQQCNLYVDSGSVNAYTSITGNFVNLGGSSYTNSYKAYRPVSAGIRFTYIGSTTSDSGLLVVGQLPAQTTLSPTIAGDNAALLSAGSSDFKTIPVRNGCQVTWRPEGMADMATWNGSVSTPAAVTTSLIYPTIYVVAFGLASASSPIQYEVVINYEGQFNNQSYIPGGIQSTDVLPPSEVGWYERMKNFVDRVTPFVPLVGNVLTAATGNPAFGAMGLTMANGLRYKAVTDKTYRSYM